MQSKTQAAATESADATLARMVQEEARKQQPAEAPVRPATAASQPPPQKVVRLAGPLVPIIGWVD